MIACLRQRRLLSAINEDRGYGEALRQPIEQH